MRALPTSVADRVKPREKRAEKATGRAERRLRILEMRKRGHAPERIATIEGVSAALVESEIRHGLASFFPKERDAMLALELARLDDLRRFVYSKASRGDVPSVMASLKISERYAKYVGMDAPEKHEHSGAIKHLNVDVTKLSDSQLRELAGGTWPTSAGGADSGGGARAAQAPEVGESSGLRADAIAGSHATGPAGADRESA